MGGLAALRRERTRADERGQFRLAYEDGPAYSIKWEALAVILAEGIGREIRDLLPSGKSEHFKPGRVSLVTARCFKLLHTASTIGVPTAENFRLAAT